MIGVVVRELTYLKALEPIMNHLYDQGAKYILYHFDAPRGDKEYNRATIAKLKKASGRAVKNAINIKAFANDKQLLQMLIKDKVSKLVSLEIWLWAKGYIKDLKKHNIKTYSVLYLTDSLWQKDPACITSMNKVYYSTKYLMDVHHDFAGIKFDSKRDQCLGSPVFDPILNKPSEGKDILILLPNLRGEHVKVSFGSADNFIKMIAKFSKAGDLIFKTRKKQWLPNEIRKYAKEIVDDGDNMYPPIVSELFKKCYMTIMFYSSGVYEAVYGGNFILNVPLPIKRWGWQKDKLKQYFTTAPNNLYQFDGVIKSVDQNVILSDDWELEPQRILEINRRWWLDKYVGFFSAGAKLIATNIIKD